EILYGVGISREGEIVDLGVKQGVIEKSGAWFSYKSDRIGQGKENAREFLLNNKDIAAEIEKEIRAQLLPKKGAPVEAVEAEGAGLQACRRRPRCVRARGARLARAPRAQPPRARAQARRARLRRRQDRFDSRCARGLRRAQGLALHRKLHPRARREGA